MYSRNFSRNRGRPPSPVSGQRRPFFSRDGSTFDGYPDTLFRDLRGVLLLELSLSYPSLLSGELKSDTPDSCRRSVGRGLGTLTLYYLHTTKCRRFKYH